MIPNPLPSSQCLSRRRLTGTRLRRSLSVGCSLAPGVDAASAVTAPVRKEPAAHELRHNSAAPLAGAALAKQPHGNSFIRAACY